MAANRCQILPYNFNAAAFPSAASTFGAYSAAGIDAGGTGTGFATTWASGGPYSGVEFINNGNMILLWWCGTTGGTAYHLIGQKGGGGQVIPYTQLATTYAATSVGWLGPWSVQGFTQQDGSQFSAAPGGQVNASTPSGVGMVCIDFSLTTYLQVRLMQLVPAIP